MKYIHYALAVILIGCQSGQRSSEDVSPVSSEKPLINVQESKQLPPEEKIEILGKMVEPEEEIILEHKYFKISYSKKHRLAKWVEYNLTKKDITNEPGVRDKEPF